MFPLKPRPHPHVCQLTNDQQKYVTLSNPRLTTGSSSPAHLDVAEAEKHTHKRTLSSKSSWG